MVAWSKPRGHGARRVVRESWATETVVVAYLGPGIPLRCPHCEGRSTSLLDVRSSLVLYLRCDACECVFSIDRERRKAPPHIVAPGKP